MSLVAAMPIDIIKTKTSFMSVMGKAIQPITIAPKNLITKPTNDQALMNLLKKRHPKGTPAKNKPINEANINDSSCVVTKSITLIATATAANKTSFIN